VTLGFLPALASAREPKPETLAAFNRYRDKTQARLDAEVGPGRFLSIDRYPPSRRRAIDEQLRRGEFYLEQLRTLDGNEKIPVPGGIVHHWVGIAFLPNATLREAKTVLEDFEHQKENYFPDVRQSKLLSEQGNHRKVFLQFYSKTVITAVFNVRFSTDTTDYPPGRTQIRSCSDQVAEVENFGKPDERELSPADSHGYMWELCTWWRIEEADGGTYIQVEAIELSRTVPFAFAWLVNPIVRSVPKTFLSRLLSSTQKAVAAKSPPSACGPSYSQPCSASCSSICRASKLPFFEAATSRTRAWSQFFSTPSPRRNKSASVTSAGT
jgi:hypothetical protein